jgi:hypothetical protein
MVYRQFVTRPVTRRDLLLPLIGGIYLGVTYFAAGQSPRMTDMMMVAGATLFGLATGVASAAVVRVWRDGATGLVMQRGGWKYLLVLVGLILIRVLLRVVAYALKLHVDETALNDAFIGMAVGNYGGRALLVGIRALALLGWNPGALPASHDVRATR